MTPSWITEEIRKIGQQIEELEQDRERLRKAAKQCIELARMIPKHEEVGFSIGKTIISTFEVVLGEEDEDH